MKVKGQITVFISMILLCMFAMVCCLVESARTAGTRWYLQTAVSSSMDSVFSRYHRQLWDTYRLLFAEYEDESGLTQDFLTFLAPYLEAENWYPMRAESAHVEDMKFATGDHGIHLEESVIDYMEFGIWDLDFYEDSAEELWQLTREAEAVKAVSEQYRGHTKEAFRLEKSLEVISANLGRQARRKKDGLSELTRYSGSGFRREAQGMIRELEQIPKLVETYGKYADELAAHLAESKMEFERRQGELGTESREILLEEIRQYESYVAQDGARRTEVRRIAEEVPSQIRAVEAAVEEAFEVERVIDEWEDDDEDSDGPDLASLWRPVRRHFEQIPVASLSFAHGVADKEKEGWLNRIAELGEAKFLALVLPPDAVLSKEELNLKEAPSRTELWTANARSVSFGRRLLINEYCGTFFPSFVLSNQEKADGAKYEMEYLIAGKDSDEANLSGAVRDLLAVRQGLNLMHILADATKREEARALALVITGASALTPLVFVATFFIMSVWALGEALCDVRGLLEGKKVALIKSGQDWHLDLDGLLRLGAGDEMDGGGKDNGFSYLSWLKILLIRRDTIEQEYRMMDLMQMNLRRTQDSFRMRRSVYEARVRVIVLGKHVFFSPAFVENVTGSRHHSYQMEAEAERSY